MKDKLYAIKKGEKNKISLKLRDSDNDKPIDLSNSTIKFRIKEKINSETYLINKTITTTSDINTVGKIVSPTEGSVVIKLNDTDYNMFICERLYFIEIWWEIESEGFKKEISSNCGNRLLFKVCNP